MESLKWYHLRKKYFDNNVNMLLYKLNFFQYLCGPGLIGE
jgi:hypothetical protein